MLTHVWHMVFYFLRALQRKYACSFVLGFDCRDVQIFICSKLVGVRKLKNRLEKYLSDNLTGFSKTSNIGFSPYVLAINFGSFRPQK